MHAAAAEMAALGDLRAQLACWSMVFSSQLASLNLDGSSAGNPELNPLYSEELTTAQQAEWSAYQASAAALARGRELLAQSSQGANQIFHASPAHGQTRESSLREKVVALGSAVREMIGPTIP
eukprot:SAG31_NODE_880_length_11279_cov_154.463238_2_plen_123_part_00